MPLSYTPADGILVLLGFAMVLTFMALIMLRRLTPLVALVLVPVVFGLIAGAGMGIGDMVIDAIGSMAPTAALLMFGIMYFGLMIDVGLFDPLVRFITRMLGDDPAKIVLGTAVLAGVVSLDGDGSTTFIITTSAMLPLYLRMGMSPVVLTCVAGLMNGTMNIVPWGGPTVRAATALGLQPTDVFVPMVPSLVVGLAVALTFAWFLGLAERKRLGRIDRTRFGGAAFTDGAVAPAGLGSDGASGGRRGASTSGEDAPSGGAGPRAGGGASASDSPASAGAGTSGVSVLERAGDEHEHRTEADLVDLTDTTMADTMLDPMRPTLRPKLLWFNLALTVVLMVVLVLDVIPLAFVFMIGTALALVVNFPKVKDQQAAMAAHAPSIVGVVGMVLAAGVLVGVFDGTGMVTAMAEWITRIIPDAMGPYLAVVTGLLSIPMTFFMSNDAFYFGVLPVLAESASHFGIAPVVSLVMLTVGVLVGAVPFL